MTTKTKTRKPVNMPGQPIVTREEGAHFYCVNCRKEYRKCQCRVYMSADTLSRTAPDTP